MPLQLIFNQYKLLTELEYKAVRSSGAGGQHVNKTSTKVVLSWNLNKSAVFSYEQKELLKKRLINRLNSRGNLQLNCSESRSQIHNKQTVTSRFFQLIEEALVAEKVRKATKPSRAVKQKRLDTKKRQSTKKTNRRKPDIE
ncbi:alternative ribosome rescue aminoacyl-tRNA hydrolase ArfB [Spongiivirga sp. MCCC 1A20706]|uniref:alternative ribosome rescue aminoacyl-tRNA hydrolase ArfB n=1 Tax=Spongiivirga sp. MCCC 1A20706 TaxID=3160963 RepID=UPI0039773290